VTVFDCAFAPSCTATDCTATFIDPRDGKSYKTVVMPDGKTWFAQNLNYTKDLTYNAYSYEANGKQYTLGTNGAIAIGSYWCPNVHGSLNSGDQSMCNIYGAFYTWETMMMVDGKYADESKTSSAWDETWVSSYYYSTGAPGTVPNADRNNARGGTTVKGGGRGICPKGWHIPTTREWAELLDKVDGDGSGQLFSTLTNFGLAGTDVAYKLRSTNSSPTPTTDGAWNDPAAAATDEFSFSLVPSGWIATHDRPYYFHALSEWTAQATSNVKGLTEYLAIEAPHDSGSMVLFGWRRDSATNVRCLVD
jgi:uncharacterized protein (TIGR02145 family)